MLLGGPFKPYAYTSSGGEVGVGVGGDLATFHKRGEMKH